MAKPNNYVKRDLEKELTNYLDVPEILAIVGPRQAGKTTLLKKIQSELENSNFLTFENSRVLDLFEEDEQEFAETYLENYDYLFIDEFQYAEKGGKKLKYIYDKYPGKKIIITGSSVAEMTVKGLKYLTGRVLKFYLSPFSFREFLRYKDKDLFRVFARREKEFKQWIKGDDKPNLSETNLKKLEKLRKEYTVYGGYPRVVLSEKAEERKKVLESIIDTYLLREIREVLSISDDREIKDLMKLLAVQIGDKINYNSICDKLETNYNTLKKRLNILEHTFILQQVRPFYTNKGKEISKSPKIYFYDNGFRNALLNSFQKPDLRKDQGELNENYFFTQSGEELKYWRTKSQAEVDFILEQERPIPFEIKTKPKLTRSFRSFQSKYKPQVSFVLNQTRFEVREGDKSEGKTYLVPLSFAESLTEAATS